jgi:hypothetical protein
LDLCRQLQRVNDALWGSRNNGTSRFSGAVPLMNMEIVNMVKWIDRSYRATSSITSLLDLNNLSSLAGDAKTLDWGKLQATISVA